MNAVLNDLCISSIMCHIASHNLLYMNVDVGMHTLNCLIASCSFLRW